MKNPFLEEDMEPPEPAPPKEQNDADWLDAKSKPIVDPKASEIEPS